MKARDPIAIDALRSVLAALDNAEAADLTVTPRPDSASIAGAVAGLGAGEVSRRVVSDEDICSILERAIAERQSAALEYDELRRSDEAQRLRAEVAILEPLRDATREGSTRG